jgi:hypothetical protein
MNTDLKSMADTAGHLTTIAAGAAEQSEHSAGTNGALEEIRGAAENTSRNMEVFTASLLTFQSGMGILLFLGQAARGGLAGVVPIPQ